MCHLKELKLQENYNVTQKNLQSQNVNKNAHNQTISFQKNSSIWTALKLLHLPIHFSILSQAQISKTYKRLLEKRQVMLASCCF